MYVEDRNRAWTSGSSWNDNRAVTIEVANYGDGLVSSAVWETLVELSADVCMRTMGFANRPEPGGVYLLNGKDTPLDSDTVSCRGAGIVISVTYDFKTNAEVRQYGQLMPDGNVR